MTTWTAHLRPDAEPLMVREGFAWGALVFGPLWLAAHRAWLPVAFSLAAYALVLLLTPAPVAAILVPALAWLHGLSGNDLRRWSTTHRGFLETHVVVARTEPEALARLLANRPDLLGRFGPAAAAR